VPSLTTSNAEIARNIRRPKGFGDAGASAVLALLGDIPVSPASLETRPFVLSPRAASHALCKNLSWGSASRNLARNMSVLLYDPIHQMHVL
jgi:hypothetical protein